MVKTRAAPRVLPARAVTTKRSAKSAPKDEGETISSEPKPTSRLRKCVVKIKRLKIIECPTSGELYFDNSAFEPARNSTLKERPIKPIRPPKEISQGLLKINPTKPVPEDSTTKKTRFFHRDQPPTRSRSSVTRNVYEFLSQSQIEDDNYRKDPAADIIQRLVEKGKACVMVPSKAGGKLRAKVKKRRPLGKRKQCSLENVAGETAKTEAKNPRKLIQREAARALSPIYEPEDDSSNDAEEIYTPLAQSNTSKQVSDGTYSHLARSVLLNQTKAQAEEQSSSRRRDLLNMARQFVSTPLIRKAAMVPQANSTTHAISPILRYPPDSAASAGGASPWRVSDQSAMPNTFSFGFNTSNLPSYSSDHTHRTRHVYVPDTQQEQEDAAPVSEKESYSNPLDEPSPTADDSNEENRPPPASSRTLVSNEQENAENDEDADSFVHLPNPRNTLQNRRPFQDINILDVVVLPSWKKNVQATPSKGNNSPKVANASPTRQRSQTRANLFGYDEILPCDDRPTNPTEARESSSANLFGFDEFLTENDVVTAARSSTLIQNETLQDKLHRLGELRPMDIELPQASSDSLRQNCFGEVPLCQRDIRQAMCSTMIAHKEPPRRKPALAADETIGLFRDEAELETTFDKKKTRRTYVKERPKRKRKQRVQVLYIDTDSSEDENEQDLQENSIDSPQKKQQLKRPRKDVEHEAKLQDFITSFNKECEEVEQFPLIIE